MATRTLEVAAEAHDTFPINGTDYVEFWVGNAKQAAHYYCAAFGFQLVGYRGPETGVRDRASYLLQQGKIRFVLTTAIRADLSPEAGRVAAHVQRHGDGVRDIALWVDDARDAFAKAVERGAVAEREPVVLRDDDGEIILAAFKIYGETVHSLVERRNYRGLFMPGFVRVSPHYRPADVGLQYVDHCVGNVELGKMNEWVEFYSHVMGFRNLLTFDDKTISTEYSSLMSKVMANGNDRIKFPINEPARGKRKSQIDEYLEFYRGPGVQHLALATDDIIGSVTSLRDRGVEFLSVPTTYYDDL
jgi:4-hydroxyphenylpyruvate dioxygenase